MYNETLSRFLEQVSVSYDIYGPAMDPSQWGVMQLATVLNHILEYPNEPPCKVLYDHGAFLETL